MTIAIYPGAFDPVTNGHLDIAVRASKLFDKIIIGVYDLPEKNLMFNTEERVEMVRQSITGLSNVEVSCFSGLTVNFARKVGAQTIVRGLRIGADFEREFEMALMNKNLAPDCELICLITNPKYQYLSSSLLKEVASLGGEIDSMVPGQVLAALKKKFQDKIT